MVKETQLESRTKRTTPLRQAKMVAAHRNEETLTQLACHLQNLTQWSERLPTLQTGPQKTTWTPQKRHTMACSHQPASQCRTALSLRTRTSLLTSISSKWRRERTKPTTPTTPLNLTSQILAWFLERSRRLEMAIQLLLIRRETCSSLEEIDTTCPLTTCIWSGWSELHFRAPESNCELKLKTHNYWEVFLKL